LPAIVDLVRQRQRAVVVIEGLPVVPQVVERIGDVGERAGLSAPIVQRLEERQRLLVVFE
jgi:hypothetical protein